MGRSCGYSVKHSLQMLSSSTVRRSFHQGGNAPSAPCSAVAISHMGLFTFKLNGIKLEKSFPQSHWPHVRYPAGKTPCPEQVNLALGAAQEPVFASPRGLWGPRSGRSPGAEHVWRTSTSGAASEPVVRGSGGTAGTWPADLPFSPAVSLCPSLSGTVLPVPPGWFASVRPRHSACPSPPTPCRRQVKQWGWQGHFCGRAGRVL